jgi:hypothetical protein
MLYLALYNANKTHTNNNHYHNSVLEFADLTDQIIQFAISDQSNNEKHFLFQLQKKEKKYINNFQLDKLFQRVLLDYHEFFSVFITF